MNLICDQKEQTCDTLNCDHSKPHEYIVQCTGKQCVLFEHKFVSDIIECDNCYKNNDCAHYSQYGNQKISRILPYCPGTRSLRKYNCTCVPVEQ